MSSRRHTRSRSAQNKRIKKNAIQTYKLVDTICQSLLFIYFLYGISADARFRYGQLLIIFGCVQLLSIILNFTFSDAKLLQRQRLYYLAALLLFCPLFFYAEHHMKEINGGYMQGIPLTLLMFAVASMALAFWYIVICYKEFRSMHGAINTGSEHRRH